MSIFALLLLNFASVFAGQDDGRCILGPMPEDRPITISTGETFQFPGCWEMEGFYFQGLVSAEMIQPYLNPYGLKVLGFGPSALVGIGAFHYNSSPVGRYREVFIATYVTQNENDTFLSLPKVFSFFSVPGSQPPTTYGGFVLKSWLDADTEAKAQRTTAYYSEVFGYGERAQVVYRSKRQFAKVLQNGIPILEMRMAEKGKNKILGLTNEYNYDYPLIGQNKWSRLLTRGKMGDSTNFNAPFYIITNPSTEWGSILSSENFTPFNYTHYNGINEMHTPVVHE